MDRLTLPQGELQLARYPERAQDTLRAWDAADELLLDHVAELDRPGAVAGITVVNDGSGALATALTRAGHRVTSVSDSFLTHRATRANLERNGLDPAAVGLRTSLDPPRPDDPPIDLLLVKVPTSLAQLEDWLRRLVPRLAPGAVVVGAGMTRHVHTSTLECFERTVGPTRTSLARKKARLVLPMLEAGLDAGPWAWPRTFEAGPGQPVVNHAGVFSAERLDIGTRFFLDHLPPAPAGHIVDLGCGNGVVGVRAARTASPITDASVTFVDESFRAVASAEATYRATAAGGPELAPARFVAGNGLFDLADEPAIAPRSVDLILCNPPFHADHAIGDATAWQMFTEAHRALRLGGELWVVGNRHLGYHAKLARLFGTSELAASNAKFVVLRAVR